MGQWLLDVVPTVRFGFSDSNHSIAKCSFLCLREGAGRLHRPNNSSVQLDQTGSNWIKVDQTGSNWMVRTYVHLYIQLYFEKTAASV